MGHRLKDHPGLCQHLHGHNYRVEVHIEGDLNIQGMVYDFSDLKSAMKVLDKYDHAMVLQTTDPLLSYAVAHTILGWGRLIVIDSPPTAENLARLWCGDINAMLPVGVDVTEIRVFESSTTSAIFRPVEKDR